MAVEPFFNTFQFLFREFGKSQFKICSYHIFPVAHKVIHKQEHHIGKQIEQPERKYGNTPQKRIGNRKYQQIHSQNICTNIAIFDPKHHEV